MKVCIDCRLQDRSAAQRAPHPALHAATPVDDLECAHTELCAPGWGTYRCGVCGSFFLRGSPGGDDFPQWELFWRI